MSSFWERAGISRIKFGTFGDRHGRIRESIATSFPSFTRCSSWMDIILLHSRHSPRGPSHDALSRDRHFCERIAVAILQ